MMVKEEYSLPGSQWWRPLLRVWGPSSSLLPTAPASGDGIDAALLDCHPTAALTQRAGAVRCTRGAPRRATEPFGCPIVDEG